MQNVMVAIQARMQPLFADLQKDLGSDRQRAGKEITGAPATPGRWL